MTTHNIEGIRIDTTQQPAWAASYEDGTIAFGATEQEAIQRLLDEYPPEIPNFLPRVHVRFMASGRIITAEWLTRGQLEKYWSEIRMFASKHNAMILVDNPQTKVTHVFPLTSPCGYADIG